MHSRQVTCTVTFTACSHSHSHSCRDQQAPWQALGSGQVAKSKSTKRASARAPAESPSSPEWLFHSWAAGSHGIDVPPVPVRLYPPPLRTAMGDRPRRVTFAGYETAREITPAAAATGELLFGESSFVPPVALQPLPFSRRGLLWRPYARSYCPSPLCGGGRDWYQHAHGNAGTPERPEGALGASCRCTTTAPAVSAFTFHAAAVDSGCLLQELDDKLLDTVLAWLCGRRGPRHVRMEYQAGAGARSLRALAATCRRGRELVASMRWVPGVHVDLFPHQVAALGRCVSLEARRHRGRVCGGILCDEAGLGKTITAIALMCRMREPQCPRIPVGAELRGEVGSPRFYNLEAHKLNQHKLPPCER